MRLAFFGLSLDNVSVSRVNLFKQIHEIVFYGKGGYDWETIYNMPIWLRKFTYKQISEFYTSQNSDNVEESINAMRSVGATKDPSPIKVPTYVTKASKK